MLIRVTVVLKISLASLTAVLVYVACCSFTHVNTCFAAGHRSNISCLSSRPKQSVKLSQKSTALCRAFRVQLNANCVLYICASMVI